MGLPLAVVLIAFVTISVFDRTSGSIVSSGETREYLLHVPHSYDPAASRGPAQVRAMPRAVCCVAPAGGNAWHSWFF